MKTNVNAIKLFNYSEMLRKPRLSTERGGGGPEESVADSVSDKLLRIRSVGISEG